MRATPEFVEKLIARLEYAERNARGWESIANGYKALNEENAEAYSDYFENARYGITPAGIAALQDAEKQGRK